MCQVLRITSRASLQAPPPDLKCLFMVGAFDLGCAFVLFVKFLSVLVTCKNTYRTAKGTDIKYFRFPKKEGITKQLILACRRDDKITIKNGNCMIYF